MATGEISSIWIAVTKCKMDRHKIKQQFRYTYQRYYKRIITSQNQNNYTVHLTGKAFQLKIP